MGGSAVACSIIVFIEALVFGLFTSIMFFDQLSAIFENTPGIDAMQNKKGEQKPKYEAVKDVFGEGFGIRWFLPTDLPAAGKPLLVMGLFGRLRSMYESVAVFQRFEAELHHAEEVRMKLKAEKLYMQIEAERLGFVWRTWLIR